MMVTKNKILQFLVHIIGWGIIFCFPHFFSGKGDGSLGWEKYLGYVVVLISFTIVFYVNYLVLIDQLLFRKKLIRFIVANMLLFTVLCIGLQMWHNYYFVHFLSDVLKDKPSPPRLIFMIRDMMMMVLTAALSVAIRMTGNWYVVENEKKELEKARSEAELQNLKSQLNPHFLFNTLNNIYSLIAINPDRAQYAVHDLSRLLRYVLYEDSQKLVNLDNELSFMRSYIELMSLRLSGNVELKVDIPESGAGIKIAPLLFISLIENAFKHGISTTEKSFIYIYFKIRGNNKIDCLIENSFFPKKESDRSGSGIGLGNLYKRLELLYPGQYTLRADREGGRYITNLELTI